MFPFNQTEKINDGKVGKSAIVKLQKSDIIECHDDEATWIVLIPGFSHSIITDTTTEPFPHHVGTLSNRASIKQIRITGVALHLTTINSGFQNEGFWEAVRIPFNISDFEDLDLNNGIFGLPVFLSS